MDAINIVQSTLSLLGNFIADSRDLWLGIFGMFSLYTLARAFRYLAFGKE